jgi:CBS domain-containing protein
MRSPVISVTPEQSLVQAAEKMVTHRVHRVFVVDERKAVGVCSTLEIMRALMGVRVEAPARDFMSSPVVSIVASDPVSVALDRLHDAEVGGLVVLGEGGWPIGVFTQIEALAARGASGTTRVDALMQPRVISVQASASIRHAALQAAATKARCVLVFDRARLAGVLSSLDFARALVALAGRGEEDTPALRFAEQAMSMRSV